MSKKKSIIPINKKEKRSERRKIKKMLGYKNGKGDMIVVTANKLCGCCDVEMLFRSRESAMTAFEKAGLAHTSITDDTGVVHEGVDTFYGFRTGKEPKRGLDYLVKLLGGEKKWP